MTQDDGELVLDAPDLRAWLGLCPEQSELQELAAYWTELRRDRMAPSRADLSLKMLAPLLERILIYDVAQTPAGRRYRFRVVGSALCQISEIDPTGKWLDEYRSDGAHRHALKLCDIVCAHAAPITARGAFMSPKPRYIAHESIRAPLSDDGENVNMILVGVVFPNLNAARRRRLRPPLSGRASWIGYRRSLAASDNGC